MASSFAISLILTLTALCLKIQSTASQTPDYQSFISCLSLHTNTSQLISTPNSPSFSSLLHSTIRNLRFVNPSTRAPAIILTPTQTSHIQASVLCAKNHSLQLRIRSGGHDYEGLSYRSARNAPFALLDLGNFRSVSFDPDRSAAWVGSGSTLGELYYQIAKNSRLRAFPAGICPTVGVGGHLGGGGFGTLLRKFGLAAENVLDANIVDANGQILDKNSMGEDLFWAIRGGGCASFGIVISWKVNLVPVPAAVSVFTIHKTSSQGAVELVHKWQHIAHKLPDELFIQIVLQKNRRNETEAVFRSLFLGNCDDLVEIMGERFRELGLERGRCKQMSWIDSVMYFAGFASGEPLEILLDRGSPYRFFKAKSDYVTEPVPRFAWEKIWAMFAEPSAGVLIMDPHGGRMDEIGESDTPYPHREGNLYNLQYFVEWTDRDEDASSKHMDWIARLYNEMGPYVSKNPRASYVNYRDLDLGVNGNGSSYSNAQVWGAKYFKKNFERLARVKGRVDPGDFFRNEQSIPPLVAAGEVVEDVRELASEEEFERSRHRAWLSFFLSNML